MVIGFDASRAFVAEPTGTERYSYQLLRALAKIDKKNTYRVYLRPDSDIDKFEVGSEKWDLESLNSRNQGIKKSRSKVSHFSHQKFNSWPENFQFKVIHWTRLWTQGGLALECLIDPPDVLFIPAHTMPIVRRPGLKVVVAIHDLGAEYLPQYHQFPHKYYLNWSTEYAVKHATKIIAVSESTKRDLIIKLSCKEEKLRVIYEGVRSL